MHLVALKTMLPAPVGDTIALSRCSADVEAEAERLQARKLRKRARSEKGAERGGVLEEPATIRKNPWTKPLRGSIASHRGGGWSRVRVVQKRPRVRLVVIALRRRS